MAKLLIVCILFVFITVCSSLSCTSYYVTTDGRTYSYHRYCYDTNAYCCDGHCCYDSKMSGASIAGIVIGVLIGIGILIATIIAILCGCRRRQLYAGRVLPPANVTNTSVAFVATTQEQRVPYPQQTIHIQTNASPSAPPPYNSLQTPGVTVYKT